jgi:hypothetical protein
LPGDARDPPSVALLDEQEVGDADVGYATTGSLSGAWPASEDYCSDSGRPEAPRLKNFALAAVVGSNIIARCVL